MKTILLRFLFLATTTGLLAGCATSYIPPGAKADLQSFAPAAIQAGFSAKPSNPFPATIVAVPVQAPGYSNHSLGRNGGQYGSGNYSLILTRKVEEQAQLDRVASLPQVAGLIGLNRMLLPAHLKGDREIRQAASHLQGDLAFLSTVDTIFFDTDAAKPLSVISLGLSPTRKISVATTFSALLMDTRTAYIYSAYEATTREATLATSWGKSDTADETRRITEKKAFQKLVDELAGSWPRLLERYAQK